MVHTAFATPTPAGSKSMRQTVLVVVSPDRASLPDALLPRRALLRRRDDELAPSAEAALASRLMKSSTLRAMSEAALIECAVAELGNEPEGPTGDLIAFGAVRRLSAASLALHSDEPTATSSAGASVQPMSNSTVSVAMTKYALRGGEATAAAPAPATDDEGRRLALREPTDVAREARREAITSGIASLMPLGGDRR